MAYRRHSESRAATAAIVGATTMIAAQVGGKATRDALFLDVFSAAELPPAMLTAALLSALAVLAMARAMVRLGPVKLIPPLFGLSALAFVGEYALSPVAAKQVAVAVYLHVAVLGSLLISGFWSVVSERFDPHLAKKVVGRVTVGATAGGLLGGLVAERAAVWLDARGMLLVLAAMNMLCALSVARIGGRRSGLAPPTGSGVEGIRLFREAPYLKLLGAMVLLTALTSGVLDYAFKAEAYHSIAGREELMSFFAVFYTVANLITFGFQTLISRRILARFGIGSSLALMPAVVALGAGAGVVMTRLVVLALVRGVEEVLSNSLHRSGYELLFTPLSPERKRPTKILIDVGFQRMGSALAAGTILIAAALTGDNPTQLALLVAATASALALWVAQRLHRGYVAELAANLEAGRITLQSSDIVDATTRRTHADTTMALDRSRLLAEIELLRGKLPAAPISSQVVSEDALGAARKLLRGLEGASQEVAEKPLDRRSISLVIPLLDDLQTRQAARRLLRQLAPRILGQLIDELLDEHQSEEVRSRLADIIRSAKSSRASLGLLSGLESPSPEVRLSCAQALGRLQRADGSLSPAPERVFAAVAQELQRPSVSLPLVFAILSLALDSEPLRLSFGGLRSEDDDLRGTSYEYLENVLPPETKRLLWPHIKAYARGAHKAPVEGRRSRIQLTAALKQSADNIVLDPAALRTPSQDDPP